MTKEVDVFLAHFGVKGMKWGVRQAQKESGRPSFNKENADVLTTPKLKIGGMLLDRDQKNFERKALLSIHKDLKKDPEPTNLDKPAHPSDKFSGDGFTHTGTNYAKYFSDKAYYYKFETGEKSFTILDGNADALWMHMNAKGDLIPESALKARKPSLGHSDGNFGALIHGDARSLYTKYADVPVTKIEEVKNGCA